MVTETKKVSYSSKKLRKNLQPGDLFKVKGGSRVYMATSMRTTPPSDNQFVVEVNGKRHTHQIRKPLGKLANGKEILGYQSIVMEGSIPFGEDGGIVTFNGDREVTVVGRAQVTLNIWK